MLHLGWMVMEMDWPTWGINREGISYWGYCDWCGSGIPVVWNYFINWNLQIHSFKLYIKLFIFLSDYVESRMKWEGLKYFNFRHTFFIRKKYIFFSFPISYYTTLYVKRVNRYMRFSTIGYLSRDCGVDNIISVARFDE